MDKTNSRHVPMDQNERLIKPDKEMVFPDMAKIPYREAVGALLYAAVGTRPDISYAVQALSQHCANPTPQHWEALKRVLKYLKGTADWGIRYQANDAEPDELRVIGYSDADWAGDVNDRVSTSGYVFTLAGAPVCWASHKQHSVALSTMEAEYMAGSDAASKAIWCRTLLGELGFPQKSPALLYMDNQSALALARNTGSQGRAKHIDIRYHFIRDRITKGELEVAHCPGETNPADIFTKPLGFPKFEQLRAQLGMSPSRGSVNV